MSPTLAAAWLVSQVRTLPALAAIASRIFPDLAPEGTGNPCLIYQLIQHDEEERIDAGAVDNCSPGFQIRIYADTRKEANGLREALKRMLQNFPAGTVATAAGSFRIEGTAFAELADDYDDVTKDYGALAVLTIHGAPA